MPKIGFLILLLLIFPSGALAEVKVNISNNMDGSNSSVKVNSDTSENNQSSGSVSDKTNIIINNNGEVKEYHGEGGNTELKSSDGKSSVTVNTTGASNDSQTNTSNLKSQTNITVNLNTKDSSPSSTPQAAVAGIFKDDSQKSDQKPGLLEYLKRELKELFNLFS